MNKHTILKTMFLKNTAKIQKSRIFWLFITCLLVFIAFFGCFIFGNYTNILSSSDFSLVRFAFLLVFLAGVICTLNPQKFLDIGCILGFVAAAFGIKNSLTLWTLYNFSQTQEFIVQKKPFLSLVSCFFNISEVSSECALKTNMFTKNIISSYTNIISAHNFADILKMNVYIFIFISILFCILYFSRKVKV
ncbi:MAG: hypothetical protein LBS39_02370 [Campylobacteraceae bacterium]|jgi:hypothetical protein|nr:hypothetical protein [Campylobacteraceae bacterium]